MLLWIRSLNAAQPRSMNRLGGGEGVPAHALTSSAGSFTPAASRLDPLRMVALLVAASTRSSAHRTKGSRREGKTHFSSVRGSCFFQGGARTRWAPPLGIFCSRIMKRAAAAGMRGSEGSGRATMQRRAEPGTVTAVIVRKDPLPQKRYASHARNYFPIVSTTPTQGTLLPLLPILLATPARCIPRPRMRARNPLPNPKRRRHIAPESPVTN